MQAREEAESEVRVARKSPDRQKVHWLQWRSSQAMTASKSQLLFSALLQPETNQPFVETDWLLWYPIKVPF